MAVVNTKSTHISNADSSPIVITNSYIASSRRVDAAATCEVAAADTDASVYRMVRVPSNCRFVTLEVLNDAITAGTDYDLGVYDVADVGGEVVDADLFATAIDMSTARTLPLNALFEVLDIDNIEKPLWDLLGLSADPVKMYDICFTANTVGSAAGTLSMFAAWVL